VVIGGELTERQDDSAVASGAAPERGAHVRVVFGDPSGVHDVAPRGTSFGRAGAERDADVVLEDPRMSRRHARVERDALAWRLADLGSRNGGYVDGAAVEPGGAAALRDGAVIRLGDTIFVFRAEPSAPPAPESDAFPGVSPPANRVRLRLRELARAAGHALVLGETGTGKERAAQAIGATAGPFVPQNCAELSRELARSELFGHLRGAFSGASVTKPGLVEVAADGVLFLDELGELALDVQGDLLRFLEDGSYRPIGATELRRSTARVVAATNVDLDEAVRRGVFRRDLLARLRASNAPLHLPPLRDRREDILGWADHFLREAGAAPARAWSAGAAECLLLYPWPENLRELRGVVRGLTAGGARWPVSSGALPEHIQAHRRTRRTDERAAASPAPAASPPRPAADPPQPAADPTRAQVIGALEQTGGRMRGAAGLLGIDRRKLYRLCEQHGIEFGLYRRGSQEE
jgi:DNA-binding NtrC family response regulator